MAVAIYIPYKFPSLNEYVNECRKNSYAGAHMKRRIQNDISWYVRQLPKFETPVKIDFIWIEGNKRRDYDNIAFSKKFILDAMVECGKLKDDNRRCVVGFSDTFQYGKDFGVKIIIKNIV